MVWHAWDAVLSCYLNVLYPFVFVGGRFFDKIKGVQEIE